VAREAAARQATMNCLPILSHQQLLYLLAMSIASRLFSLFYREHFLFRCISVILEDLFCSTIYISHWSLHIQLDFWTLATVPDSWCRLEPKRDSMMKIIMGWFQATFELTNRGANFMPEREEENRWGDREDCVLNNVIFHNSLLGKLTDHGVTTCILLSDCL